VSEIVWVAWLYYSQRTGVINRTYLHENHARVSCRRFLEYVIDKGCVWAVVLNYLLHQRDSSVSNFCLLLKVKSCKVGTDLISLSIYLLNSPSCNKTISSLQWLLVSACIQSTHYLESKKKWTILKPIKDETYVLCTRIQCVQRSKRPLLRTYKSIWVMLYKKKLLFWDPNETCRGNSVTM